MQEEISGKEFDLARNVLTLANRIVTNRNLHLKELGLTAEQADAMLFLSTQEQATITDLKNYLHIRHQTASGIVNRLCSKALLQLTVSDTDARAKTISLTPEGLLVVETLHKNGTHTGSDLLNGMSAEEQRCFSALIEKALHNITSHNAS